MPHKADILLVDDEEALCVAAEKILLKEGYRVTSVHTATEGLAHFAQNGADLIITDLALPDHDGLTVLRRAKELNPTVEVIVITGHGTVEKAVEAMRIGAYDFIEKPLDRNALLKAVAKAVEKQRLTTENIRLRNALEQTRGEEALIGNSTPMLAVKKLIRQIAPTNVSVLIQGESGTGKEIVADAIHLLSPRRDQSIVKISCAAIPETLLESELFGYERGAFTGAANTKAGKFELADGGTLFLDEIAEMSPPLQAKLLRVLQDGRFQHLGSTRDIQIDVRIISASHVDIPKAISEKRFRDDLYYRLNVVHISLPALRERPDDIPLLASHFLQKYTARMHKDVRVIAPAALDQLLAHPWPGNVRELENAVQRAIAVATDETISSFILCAPLSGTVPPAGMQTYGSSVTIPVGTPLDKVEERLIAETLAQCGGDKEKAAKMLGVSSRTLYRRSVGK
jgi:two-component system, NtrC family, response regulator HydG